MGLSWAPSEGPLVGLSIDIDYYQYKYEDLITLEGPADIVARDLALRCPQGLNNLGAPSGNPSRPACGPQTGGGIVTVGAGIPDQVIRDANLNFLRVEPTYSNA